MFEYFDPCKRFYISQLYIRIRGCRSFSSYFEYLVSRYAIETLGGTHSLTHIGKYEMVGIIIEVKIVVVTVR